MTDARGPAGLVLTDEFVEALAHLERGDHLFLTGKAGTGKSTLIRHFLSTTDRVTTVVAPTGIAALNVGGYTIHRLFGFGPHVEVEHVRSAAYRPARFLRTLGSLETLVIDEASMVRADLMDCIAAALERFGPHPSTPFGGVQIVLVGDLFQLPPVVPESEKAWLAARYETPYFFSAHCVRDARVATIELTRIFRQQGESALVSILNAVREGELLHQAREVLNGRTDPDFEPPSDEFWVTLTTTNKIATARNRRALEQLPVPEYDSTASITGDLDGFEKPTDEVLTYRVGAQVMMLSNDPADRWVNGTIGRVAQVRQAADGHPIVDVDIRGGDRIEVEPHTWDVTRPVVEGGRMRHDVVGSFTQLPFRLAWAITIHKSQGQTLERLVVDLTGGTFADGQLYVALSRATTMEGLVLRRDVLPKDLRVDQRVKRYLARGRAEAMPARGVAYIGVCLVGDEGQRWRPRPVEIAVVDGDGRETTTLVNPTRDLGDARVRYGIGSADLQLAPVLADAWPVIERAVAGLVPVGVDIDDVLGQIDFELKRGEHVVAIPLGSDLGDLRGLRVAVEREPTALGRARAIRAAVRTSWSGRRRVKEAIRSGVPFGAPVSDGGYLMSRTSPDGLVRFEVGGAPTLLADFIASALQRGPLTPANRTILDALVENLGVPIGDGTGRDADGPGAALGVAALVPGARVCFTGEPRHAGRWYRREEMNALALGAGLVPVLRVTKTRCDVVVCAEAGTQSGKATKAIEYGKAVITTEEFFAWLTGDVPADSGAEARNGLQVEVVEAR